MIHEPSASTEAPLELVVLACRINALRCRPLGSDEVVTFRTAVGHQVPGDILTVAPTKRWTHARHPYIAGSVLSTRVDVDALGLTPFALHSYGEWNPKTECWRSEHEPYGACERAIMKRGKRMVFEMDQVLPGVDVEEFDADPICEASDLNAAGDREGAERILMDMLALDLRCLDAHAHLGNFIFDRWPDQALRHYEIGVAIGSRTLEKDFDGLLPWGLLDNRPFLRCMDGLGLCLWRLGKFVEAAEVFQKMLWLNPNDNQGARFSLANVEDRKPWTEPQN
jgi:hypothetical protein